MVTMVLILIAVLVVLKILSSVRDRQMRDTSGVSLGRETWVDHLPRSQQHHQPWASSSGGSLWYDGGDPGDGGGDFDAGDSGGGGDFEGDSG